MLLIILALMWQGNSRAEEARQGLFGMPEVQALLNFGDRESGFDAGTFLLELLRGDAALDAEWAENTLKKIIEAVRNECLRLPAAVAVPALMCLLLGAMFGGDASAMGMPTLLCACACAASLLSGYRDSLAIAREVLAKTAQAAQLFAPAVVSVLTLTGEVSAGAAVTPLAAECGALIEEILSGPCLTMCTLAAGVASAASLSARFRLDRLFDLAHTALRWLMGILMFLFAASISATGVAAARGGAAIKAAQSLAEGVIPIIGGEISDSTGALFASATAVRNALGVTGLALLAHMGASPLLILAGRTLSLKIVSAVLEPMGADQLSTLAAHFASAHQMLIACCAAALMLAGVMAGGIFAFIGRI